MKDKHVVTKATSRVLDFIIDDLKEERAEKRAKLYRKIGLDLIDLGIRMQIEHDDY